MRIQDYCKDINTWPDSWKGCRKDVEYGQRILDEVFVPFLQSLISSGLARSTLKRHIDNTWMLGGELIYRINEDEGLRCLEPKLLVLKFVSDQGGHYTRHLDTDEDQRSFNATGKKIYKFLVEKINTW